MVEHRLQPGLEGGDLFGVAGIKGTTVPARRIAGLRQHHDEAEVGTAGTELFVGDDVELRPGAVTFLETLRSERAYPGNVVDREFQDVHAVVVAERRLTDYALRYDEVSVLYEAPLARAIALYRDGLPLPVAGWDCQARHNDALLVADDLIAEGRANTLASLERLEAWWTDRTR